MRAPLILSLVFGLVSAFPRPQQAIDVDAMLADFSKALATISEAAVAAMTENPSVIQYDQAAAVTAAVKDVSPIPSSIPTLSHTINLRVKRGVCPSQGVGYGPRPTQDTPEAFLSDPTMSSLAVSAPTSVGLYTRSFKNSKGSNQQLGYLTYYTLKRYDALACSAKCDQISQCSGFNLYFERAPIVEPNDSSCSNPNSTTLIKCAVYGYPVYGATATNVGQYRRHFRVVIAGSNGYSKFTLPPAPTGFTNATAYKGAIRSYKAADMKYITYKSYTGPVDVRVCAAACQSLTKNNRERPHSKNATAYDACNFFNIWVAVKANIPVGWTCSMYVGPPNRTGMDDNYGQGTLQVVNSIGYTASPIDVGIF